MHRRSLLAGLAASACYPLTTVPARADYNSDYLPHDHPLQQSWQQWKVLCLSDQGRVIDSFQGAASHSEGQGYGLVLAAIFDDEPAFDLIRGWTEDNLAIRDDALMSWRWQPDAVPQVQDSNNASDGDLFFAWGLVLAGARRQRPELIDSARAIAQDLVRLCAAPAPDGSGLLMLLPAASGFSTAEQLVLNPSYIMPRAMREVAAATGVPQIVEMAETGAALIRTLSQNGLVPDWVSVTAQGVVPAPATFSNKSGYEAIRVPLFALWSGEGQSQVVRSFVEAVVGASASPTGGGTPVILAPRTREVVERSTHAGYAAVAALSACASSHETGSTMRPFTAEQPYYPATLHLMALVVQATLYSRCVPI